MEYEIIRSSRRSLAIEVGRDGKLTVRAPYHCPEDEIEKFIAKRADWIERSKERQKKRSEDYPEPNEAEKSYLLAKARAVLPEKTERYANIMGLHPSAVRITGASTRFGSCSPKNVICYSWRLMQYPDEAVDYVVVHELAHIAHKNHGKQFYSLIETVLPDYKDRVKLLKD